MKYLTIVPLVWTLIVSAAPAQPRRSADSNQPVIVVPVADKSGNTILAAGPGGSFPVFKLAPNSSFVGRIQRVFGTAYMKKLLWLDRLARNLKLNELHRYQATAPRVQPPHSIDDLSVHRYLLLSKEEGGFAREGFWLQDPGGKRRFVNAGYVDMVVDDDSVSSGEFEEIFAHELGHLIVRTLMGRWPVGFSRKMHMSMATTDYPTAFDEGFAEHLQPVVRDHTTEKNLVAVDRGTASPNFKSLWQANVDRELRNYGVRRNLFVHQKLSLSAGPVVDEGGRDVYQQLVASETSPAFEPSRFKNGQQMMACEGVIATIFYRLVNNADIQHRFRDAAFYKRFLLTTGRMGTGRPRFDPYENAMLKVFAAMNELGRTPVSDDQPLMLDLVKVYGRLFPDEKHNAYSVLIATTYGATVSVNAATEFERLSDKGYQGNQEFVEQLPSARRLMEKLIADAVEDKTELNAALGPELWILNSGFKIGRTVFDRDRVLAMSLNLNTATAEEFVTIPGIGVSLATKILSVRRAKGFFSSLDELRQIDGVSSDLVNTLIEMQNEMQKAGGYERQ